MRAQEKNVPSKSTSRRFNQKWFSRNCKRMVRRKNRRYKVYQRTKLDSDWRDKYQVASKAARKVCRNAHNNYVDDFFGERKKNPKKFYSYIKSKNNDNVGISSLSYNGELFTTDHDIANVLNMQFASVFSADDGITPKIKGQEGPQIGELNFTLNGVKKLIQNLDCNKASGPDGV